ncbi:hypothetical protein AAG570_000003 [Ranatra chinensis]|uniref:RING-type domain-containing protein n=1 Tax=Ranatra chinensis TaxID=642074 RepID=A0ABD0YVU7_9HEMI
MCVQIFVFKRTGYFGLFQAFVVYAKPANACSALEPPPYHVPNFTGRWAVLIRRYDCSFDIKVRNAQNASYDIAIVHNVNSSDLERMSTNTTSGIYIPSIFVGGPTGLILKDNYQYFDGYYIIIDDDSPFDINVHLLLPFAIVVGLCFVTMIGFMIFKCINDRRREQRHRLPYSSLQQIPTAIYRRGDPYETCAVCLEDFVEGEKLRILLCSHAYHCNCIDPWLTRGRRVCPMCKRKVFAGCESCVTSDSDTSSEEDDNTPLLRSSQQTTGGTFNNVRIHLL